MRDQQLSLSEQVMMRDVDGQVVLLDLRSGCYFTLDGSAVDILPVLLESASVGAALARLVAIIDVDEATLEADLVALIGELQTKGLVKLA